MVDTAQPDTARMAQLRGALERELGPDEDVLWHGWHLGRVDPRDFMIYVFAVPWTAFSIAWTGIAAMAIAGSGEDGPGLIGWAFPLFGLPFIAVGLWMLSRPFAPVLQRGRVLYVVTSKRVLKLGIGRVLETDTVPADRIGLAKRREQRDGTGSLQLAVKIGRDSDGNRQTEDFIIGPVADAMGAQQAVDRIALAGAASVAAPALSS